MRLMAAAAMLPDRFDEYSKVWGSCEGQYRPSCALCAKNLGRDALISAMLRNSRLRKRNGDMGELYCLSDERCNIHKTQWLALARCASGILPAQDMV